MVSTLLGRTIRELGPKRAAPAMGYQLGYTYALARDPADPEHPDNSGTETDPWMRVVGLLEVASTYPRMRPLLREWRLVMDELFARLLDRAEDDPANDEHLIADAAVCARESGEAVAATLTQARESGDYADALREVLEAQEALDHLARALQRRLAEEPQTKAVPLRRRA